MNDNITKIIVNLNERSYPIYIGEKLIGQDLLQHYIIGQQVLVVTDDRVAPLYLEPLTERLAEFQCDHIILPHGEEHKSFQSLELIFNELLAKKHRRNTTLLALGGGVVGDITGFAAACYQRGANFIQIPTTLLSQVDASVGGKTAINHPMGKNMIGAFYQPRAVLIDIHTVKTLSEREFQSGLAEVIKAALISDEEFFCWLESNIPRILNREQPALLYAIQQAVAIKVKIVVADEKEADIRAFLNLGHTFAHGIEHALGFGTWLHGEAVAAGMVLAADFSHRVGWLDETQLLRVKNILTMANLPIRLPSSLSAEQLIESMSTDKKKEAENVRLVLLKGIGQAVLSPNVDEQILEATIADNRL